MRTTNRDIAADRDLVTLETLRKKGPVHRRRGFLIYTIIVDATDNADNLAPIIFCADANALAQGVARIPKHFARHIFGDCAHRKLFVGVLPGEISARDKGNAQNFKKAGGDKPESSQWRKLAFGIGLAGRGFASLDRSSGVLCRCLQRWRQRWRRRGAQFPVPCESRIDVGFGDRDTEGLDLCGRGESGNHFCERAKGANHETRANQKHKSQRNLHDDQGIARAMLFATLAEGAAAFTNAGAKAHSRIFEDRNAREQRTGNERHEKGEK